MILGGHIEVGDPLMKEAFLAKVGDPLTEEDILIEDLLEEDILIGMGEPLEEEDALVEDPLMEMEDPLVMEDLLVMGTPWTSWWTRTPGPQGPSEPVRPIILQTPQVMLDALASENTFDTVGQSMLK